MLTLRKSLDAIEFADLTFEFKLGTPCVLRSPELTLRPKLHRAGLERLDPDAFERLFTPLLPDDPTALRRYQRPAPPFALQPQHRDPGIAAATATIQCHLFGDGISLLEDLIETMQGVTPFSDGHDSQEGHLIAVSARDGAGTETTLWRAGITTQVAPPRIAAAWRFDTLPAACDWSIEFLTPARLLAQKKPLFRPALRHLLPFVLRRVTAMAYFWSAVEITGAAELLTLADGLHEEVSELRWHDWRPLGGEEVAELGGVLGQLRLAGPLPDDLLLLLQLGSLLNIGKGAAYGAGAYRLIPA